jgi:hypothetical protein
MQYPTTPILVDFFTDRWVVWIRHEDRIAVLRQALGHVSHGGAQAKRVHEQDNARPLPLPAGLRKRRVAHPARCLYLDLGDRRLVRGGRVELAAGHWGLIAHG